MSFILDALRKSDAERQRTVTPGLSDVRYATRRNQRNLWLPVLVIVLVANMVFMAVQWFGRGGDPAPVEPTAAPPAVTGTAPLPAPAPAAPAAAPPEASIRPLAREAEFGEPALEPDMDSEFGPTGPVVTESPEPPSAAADVPPPPVTAPLEAPAAPAAAPPKPATPSRIVAGNELPTAEQLIGSGALNVPILNLDLHVYSDAPASRFVVINTRKYKEGGQLTEGPKVESITKDGVILNNQGRRFTLSRK